MLNIVQGDFFDYDADIRINTVNCVGVMGAGVALAFKKKYPAMFKEYVRQCKNNEIMPGKPGVWKEGDMFSKGVEIINFPTKDHWRKPSEYQYIESGLVWLSDYLKDKKDSVVTLPALGCGHGGLDWDKVKSLIEKYLEDTPGKVLVFEPSASKNTGKMVPPADINELKFHNIAIVENTNSAYPVKLTRYTEKPLYQYGDPETTFDISVVANSKPDEIEKKLIGQLINYSLEKGLSLLFGGSAFDKKFAYVAAKKGVRTGVFLPAGILDSARKSQGPMENLTVMSIGNPFVSFSKKDYMPSVLSRIFIADSVLITTEKLSWVTKNKKTLSKDKLNLFYPRFAEEEAQVRQPLIDLGAKGLDLADDTEAFDKLIVEDSLKVISG